MPEHSEPDNSTAAEENASSREGSQGGGRSVSTGRWLAETGLLLVVALVVAQAAKAYVVQPFVIPTGSMIPTIEVGDYVLAEKITFRWIHKPEPGDIVVFDDPRGQLPQLIKRVVAVDGQTVELRGDAVYVDGRPLDEPYVHGTSTMPGSVPLPLTVPSGQVWLMGDNRPSSGDSRFFGPVDVETVRGRAFWTYWPLGAFGPLN